MLVILPVFRGDVSLAQRNLEWVTQLEDHTDHDALLANERSTDTSLLLPLATRYFRKVAQFTYDDYAGSPHWPAPQNYAWQTIARHIATLAPPQAWFWWEADVTPLRRGWLSALSKEYHEAGRPFMGRVGSGGYMGGVAVYPPNVLEHTMDAMLVRQQSWDSALWKDIRHKTHAANHLMAHFPRYTGVQLSCDDPAAIRKLIDKGYVVFHGCNDGSLVDLLMGLTPRQGILRKVVRWFRSSDVEADIDESEAMWQRDAIELQKRGYGILAYQDCRTPTPSILKQTPWPCGVFPLPLSSDQCHYNCGLVRGGGKLWLVTRRWLRRNAVWHSDLTAWSLDEDLYPTGPVDLRFPRYTGIEQYEDPRVVWHAGQFHVAHCTWRHGRLYRAHQSLSTFDTAWHWHSTLNVPYGGNGYTVGSGPGDEKNWVWFHHDNAWHFIYSVQPHVIIRVDTPTQLRKYETSLTPPLPWIYGEIRGGTPPIRVGDEYISFFHSSLPWRGRQKRYYAGAYAFSAIPPFAITRMTIKPLLCASEDDTRILQGPLVVFPGGSILENNEWLLVFGVNDEASGWLRIPNDVLSKLLQRVDVQTTSTKG